MEVNHVMLDGTTRDSVKGIILDNSNKNNEITRCLYRVFVDGGTK